MTNLSRRDWLRLTAAGAAALSASGWLKVLASHTAQAGKKTKSCIVLWMDGGPSHKDTFDMKPGTRDAGEFQPIATSVPGIQISEHLPQIAKWMHEGAIIRSMSTGEGAHDRARYNLHTGYKEGSGGTVHPALGSIVSAELGNPESPMPNFVSVLRSTYGSGFLGARHRPLVIGDPNKGVENLKPNVAVGQFDTRVGLLEEMESAFHQDYQAQTGIDHRTTYQRAVTLMKSKEVKAFDLTLEPPAAKEKYGNSQFGRGCLLAPRLVEVGVPFIEVALGGWDTHQDNFGRIKTLCGQLDTPWAALLADLKERGLLETTLVVWMGEFGRSPKINHRSAHKPGRDHHPAAWSSVLLGGGIKGGQVIGKTDAEGTTVAERVVPVLDFMATICKALGIDYTKNNATPTGRPIRIVDKGAKPIEQLF